jgi:predicted metal-dependent enzyme (double-stranded beta helix superfamily)
MHDDTSLPPQLRRLSDFVRSAQRHDTEALLEGVAQGVAQADDMLGALSAQELRGKHESYTRHVAYADPHGHFTIVYLVWQPGQHSPVHGHRTWCAYRVLKGELTEEHYRWDGAAGRARRMGSRLRTPGDIITAPQGLGHIHRLGNDALDVAVSLHIYGVDEASLATGVNHLVDSDAVL